MRIVTMPWAAPIRVFGLLAVLLPVAVLAFWPLLLRLLQTPPPGTGACPAPEHCHRDEIVRDPHATTASHPE